MTHQEIIERAGHALASAAPRRSTVVLFGSHARGTAATGSDLDFLVIEPDPVEHIGESARLRRSIPPLGVPIDVIVVGRGDAEDWSEVRGTVIHAALSEGRVVAET